MKQGALCASILFLLSQPAFAMFCPGNFNVINLGDSIAQVESQCGPPDSKKTVKEEADVPQEWTYYTAPTGAMQNSGMGGTPSSIKMTVAFVAKKVVNITVSGFSLSNTPLCGNNIQIGDTMDTVKAACGKSQFITKAQTDNGSGAAPAAPATTGNETTTDTYNSSPPVSLIFQNGVLTGKK